jgi:hypothetical protein
MVDQYNIKPLDFDEDLYFRMYLLNIFHYLDFQIQA